MSLTATSWAWQTPTKSLGKYVLLALADYADANGKCYSSLKNLAKKCGLSRSTICLHLQKLRAEGYIDIAKQVTENGYQNCNHYKLQIPKNYLKTCPHAGNTSPPYGLKIVRENDRNYINSNVNVLGPLSGPQNIEQQKKVQEILEGK